MALKNAQRREDHNRRRRELYHTDPTYRAGILQKQREAYNREKGPLESRLSEGLLREGVEREVKIDGLPDIYVMEAFTLREAGEALGRALLTIRSWIENEVIPAPMAEDASTGYQQYLRFELELLADVLAAHETHSQYVSTTNEDLIDRIWGSMNAGRDEFLADD